jgi:hypothetical protein
MRSSAPAAVTGGLPGDLTSIQQSQQAASERIGRETVTYVSNIYKHYVAYRLVVEENERRAAAKAALTGGQPK